MNTSTLQDAATALQRPVALEHRPNALAGQPSLPEEQRWWRVQTQLGISLAMPPSLRHTPTGALLADEGQGVPELGLLRHLLQPGQHALDLGAGNGLFALAMALASGMGADHSHDRGGASDASGPATRERTQKRSAGRVWAFEPRQAPRAALLRSIADNGLQQQVQVVPWALAERPKVAHLALWPGPVVAAQVAAQAAGQTAGQTAPGAAGEALAAAAVPAVLSTGQDGSAAWRETVRMDRLDSLLQLLGIGHDIALVKLSVSDQCLQVLAGAKRFFAEQSPTVVLESQRNASHDPAVLDALSGLGYGIFRFSEQLQLLLPFELRAGSSSTPDAPRFLIAVRRPSQLEFAERGLLVTAQALALAAEHVQRQKSLASPEALAAQARDPAARHALAYAAVSAAHSERGMAPAWRVECMIQARDALLQAAGAADVADAADAADAAEAPGGLPVAGWVLLVHCLQALGQPAGARQLGTALLAHWPEQADPGGPVWPPLRAQCQRPQSVETGSWLKQMLAEYLALGPAAELPEQRAENELANADASGAPSRQSLEIWDRLLAHPDHGAEVERRALLQFALADRCAPLHTLHHLSVGQPSCNLGLWRGLITAMRSAADA